MAEYTAWCSHCQFITFITFLFTVNVIRQMAPLFSKVDSNKLWRDVQHEDNVIYAQSRKDLFNISKVIGRKKVAQFFLTYSVYYYYYYYWNRTQSTKLKYKNNRQTDKESCSTNTLNSNSNLSSVKQTSTLIRVVSKHQHVVQHVNFG